MATNRKALTDDEGTFLALLLRVQPATTYELSKIYADSPVSSFGVSKGKIYPLVRRLQERGLVMSKAVAGDGRRSAQLQATPAGQRAVHRWVLDIRPHHLLLEDPLRTKVQSFGLLSKSEQLEWIRNARQALEDKLAELEDYAEAVAVTFKEQVHDSAVSALVGRLGWLERLRESISPDGPR